MTLMIETARSLLVAALLLALSACATVDFDYPREESHALSATDDTGLGMAIADQLAMHPGQTGFRPLFAGIDALAARLITAERAERSIDAQYFLIHDDTVGHVFLDALLRAADRGVRVRLLIDDIHTDGFDTSLAAIDAHSNMEIRLFNPFGHRTIRALDAAGGLRRVLRRMHNKSFIVDNQIAIIGGRNIGDEYFDASEESKFGDLDVVAVGAVVPEVSDMFDLYWNHKNALPMPAINEAPDDPQGALNDFRDYVSESRLRAVDSPYGTAVRRAVDANLGDELKGYFWATYEFVYDPPEKSERGSHVVENTTDSAVRDSLLLADHELLVLTPYFVLDNAEQVGFKQLAASGVDIAVVTNSLASNNHAVSHSGYMPIRKPLLSAGVRLYEVRADARIAGDERIDIGEATTTLHAKAFVVDRREVFIGSFNWNQRSVNVDTEMGVIINSPELGEMFGKGIEEVIEARTWRLELDEKNRIRWHGTDNGVPVVLEHEPQTGFWRRFSAGFLRWLPIKSQL